MPGKPRKPSPTQQAYNQEIKRLQRFIKQAQRRGYIFPDNAIPPQPKRITKSSVTRLQKITPKTLYKKAKYTVPSTGQTVSGEKGRTIERRASAQKAAYTRLQRQKYYSRNPDRKPADETPPGKTIPAQTDEILRNVEDIINSWTPDPRWSAQLAELKRNDKNVLSHVLHGQISSLGRETVAKNLQEANNAFPGIVTDCVYAICYGSGSKYAKDGHAEVQGNLKRFMEMCQGHSMSQDEAKDLSYQLDELAYIDDTDE